MNIHKVLSLSKAESWANLTHKNTIGCVACKQQTLFFIVLESGSPVLECQYGQILVRTEFPVYRKHLLVVTSQGGREEGDFSELTYTGTNPTHEGFPFTPSSNPKDLTSYSIMLRVRISTQEFWEDTNTSASRHVQS